MTLTKRQHDVLQYIVAYQAGRGVAPTLVEIAEHFGLGNITVFEHIKKLDDKGYLRKGHYQSRGIEVLHPAYKPRGVEYRRALAAHVDGVAGAAGPPRDEEAGGRLALQVLGRIAAGTAIEAIEDPESFALEDLVPPDARCYVLRVQGDSMIDEGIRDGDYVIVERRPTARNGETVVAVIGDNEATLKKFYREGDRVRLQPANDRLTPIYVQEVEIRGVVVGVVRKY
ncbi:MAG: transcriptional repressor LexA [Planctomycetes bacterium]|nr:transcriptional repressor LexA [Planctomycetota bacterium]